MNQLRAEGTVVSEHLDLLAEVYSGQHISIYPLLDQSLTPRSAEVLFDLAANYLNAGDRVLDIGCRDAAHLIRLAQSQHVTGVGIDPVERCVLLAKTAVEEAGLEDHLTVIAGVMERIDAPADCFDFVWCRDVVEHVENLEEGLAETARVMTPEAKLLLYTTFATDLLSDQEASTNFGPRGIIPRNMDERYVEAAFAQAGLRIESKDVVGSEWREYAEEHDHSASRALLRLARLRRQRDEVIERFGKDIYDRAVGGLQWPVFQLLGKLQPTVYLLSLDSR